LTVLAQQLDIRGGLLIPMLDARRMEVYSAVFNPEKQMLRKVDAQIIDETSFADVAAPVHIVGDCQEKLKNILLPGKFVYHPNVTFPRARDMGELTFGKFRNADFENLSYFEPFYLKDFMFPAPGK
jgi:tRNA threonylcarbamoyladenosine biosynthesis protein TsaB